MAGKRDGVEDGWILYQAWCKRNHGTPVRGTNSAGHMCIVGPTGQTIDPGDEGTVDIALPEDGRFSKLDRTRLELGLRAAKLRRDEAELEYERTTKIIEVLKNSEAD